MTATSRFPPSVLGVGVDSTGSHRETGISRPYRSTPETGNWSGMGSAERAVLPPGAPPRVVVEAVAPVEHPRLGNERLGLGRVDGGVLRPLGQHQHQLGPRQSLFGGVGELEV